MRSLPALSRRMTVKRCASFHVSVNAIARWEAVPSSTGNTRLWGALGNIATTNGYATLEPKAGVNDQLLRWRSAPSRRMTIPITTGSRRFGSAVSRIEGSVTLRKWRPGNLRRVSGPDGRGCCDRREGRYGSVATFLARSPDVCLTPDSGAKAEIPGPPLWAKNCHRPHAERKKPTAAPSQSERTGYATHAARDDPFPDRQALTEDVHYRANTVR